MFTMKTGDLLTDDAFALVNTVNTHGAMGKGIALAFKKAYPSMYQAYRQACQEGRVVIGKMHVVRLLCDDEVRRMIINFPTKKDWRNESRLIWVCEGLTDLKRVILENKIPSIAVPALGCQNGGLRWSEVKTVIETVLGDLDCDVRVYTPHAFSLLGNEECSACGAWPQDYHEHNCDQERCLETGLQKISCGCHGCGRLARLPWRGADERDVAALERGWLFQVGDQSVPDGTRVMLNLRWDKTIGAWV